MKVVPSPVNSDKIGILVLFSTKHDTFLNKWKAKIRIVAKRDTQPKIPDVYAPVASVVGVRLFLILVIHFHQPVRQLYITGSF